MSGQPKKLRMEEGKADNATRSPPKKKPSHTDDPQKEKAEI